MLRRALLFGLVRGALATACMTAVMLAFRKGEMHRRKHPPERIAQKLLQSVTGKKPSESELQLATATTHLGFGIGVATLFASLWQKFGPKRRWPVIHGMLFSLGVGFLSYKGWAPSLGLMPPPERDRPGRVAGNVSSHLVYGAVLGAKARELESPVRR